MSNFIRLVHPKHYDHDRDRFVSAAFSVSKEDKGVSIICIDCAIKASGSICAHVANFYQSSIAGSPAVYWPLKDLPADTEFVQTDSDTGDKCHYITRGLSKNKARNIAKAINYQDCFVCPDEHQCSMDDIVRQNPPAN